LWWADGADQRTRASAQNLAAGMGYNGMPAVSLAWSANSDPLFDDLDAGVCKLNPSRLVTAVANQGALESPEIRSALSHMQSILAPNACTTGNVQVAAGTCLAQPSKINFSEYEAKIVGPLATAATVSEALLLEYENGLPMQQVGFGRADRADIVELMKIHDHTSNLTRRTPYIAVRRANSLLRLIADALTRDEVSGISPAVDARKKLVILVGHDTNLSNLAGALGLDWQLPGQPDATAPGTALAFERWRNNLTGQAVLRMHVYYQAMDQVRTLVNLDLEHLDVTPAVCTPDRQACDMGQAVQRIRAMLPEDCTR
jgi:4-phytase/acid phosphatase